MDALIARVQRLIDRRSEWDDPLAWNAEALYLGDLPALCALAAVAARAADRQILITREVDARRNVVYEACTTPELIKRWWGGKRGEVTAAEIDLRVGGKWRFVVVEGNGRRSAFHGEYREVLANERIVSTAVEESTQRESVNTVVFSDVDKRTRLTLLIHFASPQARDAAMDSGTKTVLQEQMNLLAQAAASLA